MKQKPVTFNLRPITAAIMGAYRIPFLHPLPTFIPAWMWRYEKLLPTCLTGVK